MDLLLADGQGLQRTVVDAVRPLHPLAPLPRAERAGQLCEGEQPLSVAPVHLLLAHASEQADVVGLLGLPAAPLPELADLAVPVQRQPRWLASLLKPLDLIQHPFRLS